MSDQRILSAEQLARALWGVRRQLSGDDKSECEIRLHIAALTEQHAAMKEVNKCGSCSGTGWIAEPYSTSETGWGCSACDGTGNKLHAQARELARVTKERDLLAEKMERALIAVAHFTHRDNESHAELAALKAERAEDTARLDWLETELEREKIDGHWVHSLFRHNVPIKRQAIDAARAAGKEGE